MFFNEWREENGAGGMRGDFLFDIWKNGCILSNENFIINIKKIILWKQLLRKLKTAKS